MQRTLLLLLLLLLPGLVRAAEPASSPYFPYPLKVERLPNGLTVARVPFNSPGLVAYVTVVRVGSRNEVEPGRTGFAHFFEHMMFKGTPRFPEGEREQRIGKWGFDDNAFTSDDVTVYYSYGPSASLEPLVELEADRFRNLTYAEPSFRTEALAVLGEYHKSAASPELKLEELLLATAFTRHTYRHTTIGFYEDIKAMPEAYEYSRTFFQRWYTPDNTLLFIVGDFNDEALMKAVRTHYGPWQSKAASVSIPPEPPQKQPRSAHLDWPQSTLPRHVHAWRTPASRLDGKEGAIQAVLGSYLTGPTSPLYKQLVLEKQLVQAISADPTPHRDPYLFTIYATLREEAARPAVRAALEEAVRELASGKVDAQRVRDIQSNVRYSQLMQMETARDVAIQLAYYAGVFGPPDAFAQFARQVDTVQPADLVSFARKHLTDSNRTVITLSSKAGGQP